MLHQQDETVAHWAAGEESRSAHLCRPRGVDAQRPAALAAELHEHVAKGEASRAADGLHQEGVSLEGAAADVPGSPHWLDGLRQAEMMPAVHHDHGRQQWGKQGGATARSRRWRVACWSRSL